MSEQEIYEEFQKSPLGIRQQMNKKKLGSGSQAIVFEIQNKNSQEQFAMKVYERDTPKKLKNSEQESLEILGQGQSEYVVKMIECCTYKERLWIVLELCECNLRNFWNKQKKFLGPIDEEEIFSILKFLCNVYYDLMMNAIIHRDLKPENILVTKQKKYKLTDFGISKQLENFYSQSMSTKQQGTINYMSPQQHLQLRYTSKCDVWSAGIIIYELHQGVLPWGELNFTKDKNQNQNQNIKQFFQKVIDQGLQFNPNIPISQELKEILHKLLAYEENDRYSWFDLMQHKNIKTERLKYFQQQYVEKERNIIEKIKSELSKFCDCSELFKQIMYWNIDPQNDKANKVNKIIVKPNDLKSYIQHLGIKLEDSQVLFLFNKMDHKQENQIKLFSFKKWLEDNQIIKTQYQETITESMLYNDIEWREEDPTNTCYQEPSDENDIFDQIFQSVNPIIYGLIRKLDQKKELNKQIFTHNLKILFHQFEKQINQQYKGYIDYQSLKELLSFQYKKISDELMYLTFKRFDQNQTNLIRLDQFEKVLSEYYQKYIYHINYVILTLVIAMRNYNCDVNLLFLKYISNPKACRQAIRFEGFYKLIKQIDQDITQEQIELAFDYFCLENLQHIEKQRFIQIIEIYKQKL